MLFLCLECPFHSLTHVPRSALITPTKHLSNLSYCLFFFFFFLIYLFGCPGSHLQHKGTFSCGMWTLSWGMWGLVPWPGIEPGTLALGLWSLRHWTPREVPSCLSLISHYAQVELLPHEPPCWLSLKHNWNAPILAEPHCLLPLPRTLFHRLLLAGSSFPSVLYLKTKVSEPSQATLSTRPEFIPLLYLPFLLFFFKSTYYFTRYFYLFFFIVSLPTLKYKIYEGAGILKCYS